VRKRNLLRLFAVLMLLLLPVSSAAAQTGSLLIQEIDHPVALYQVTDENGEFTEAFSQCGPSLSSADQVEAAKELKRYAQSHRIPGKTIIPERGEAFFTPLDEGTYLVCSLREKGEFAPFFLNIPIRLDGKPIYHVQAKPKLGGDPGETESTRPPETRPSDAEIPQTGTSVIPRYTLMVLGTLFTLAGLYEVLAGREEQSHD